MHDHNGPWCRDVAVPQRRAGRETGNAISARRTSDSARWSRARDSWRVSREFLAAVLCSLATMPAGGGMITGVTAHGWPNERPSPHEPPARAVDGDINSYTWTTASYNTQVSYFGLDFGRPVSVDRIRLFKDNWGGGGPDIKNLEILVTADASAVPLRDRSFVRVSSLSNGYLGAELLRATSVNSDGTVVGDIHNLTDGWASLSFTGVVATGLAIQFYYPGSFQHYKVHEAEVYSSASPVPEIDPAGMGSVLALVVGSLGVLERRRRRTA